MTNEKLGVLLVDVPEPRHWKYTFVINGRAGFEVDMANTIHFKSRFLTYKCTQEEAKKYPQFRWVALEELT